MNRLALLLLAVIHLLLAGCSPVKPSITNQYTLSAYSEKQYSRQSHVSILVNAPEAVAGYQTEQMLYMKKPYELSAFAHNGWIDPPADMLFPLLLQSLQRSGYFYAVASSASAEATDYHLDTQLIELKQNFLQKPSTLNFRAKVVLTRVKDNRVIASKVIALCIPCPADTPYGGVVAANLATQQFTAQVTAFVINKVR